MNIYFIKSNRKVRICDHLLPCPAAARRRTGQITGPLPDSAFGAYHLPLFSIALSELVQVEFSLNPYSWYNYFEIMR